MITSTSQRVDKLILCLVMILSKVVEDHVHSEISNVVEDPLGNPDTPVIDESNMSSAGTNNVDDVLVDSSTLTPDGTCIHEENQKSQETEIESIVAIPSVFFSNQSLEFLAMVHQVSFVVSSLNGCLEFSLKFLHISICPSNV